MASLQSEHQHFALFRHWGADLSFQEAGIHQEIPLRVEERPHKREGHERKGIEMRLMGSGTWQLPYTPGRLPGRPPSSS